MSQKAKAKIVKDVTQLVLARRTRMCNFLEYKGAEYAAMQEKEGQDSLRQRRRHEGCVQAICVAVLRSRNQSGRQRAGGAGDYPSLR